jgi:hypothetical protein
LLVEIESHCAAAGVTCEIRASDQSSSKRKVLILAVPTDVSQHAFATLSSWIYVRVGTRPYDLSEVNSDAVRHRDAIDAVQANNAWTSRDLEFLVGRMVRAEFLAGIGSICASTGARWESRVERNGLIRTTVVTVSGTRSVVDETVSQLFAWQRRFPAEAGG